MSITIAERIHPYSHTPGTSCLIPGTSYQVQVFPALIRLYDLAQAVPLLLVEVSFAVQGPMRNFTVVCDLEKGYVRGWGETAGGLLRYRLVPLQKGIRLDVEKAPELGLPFTLAHKQASQEGLLQAKHSVLLWGEESPLLERHFFERLSLGNHKAQDWDLVQRRRELVEIFPAWHRLGQFTPPSVYQEEVGAALLLSDCRAAIQSGKPETIVKPFNHLFLAGFHHILVPRLADDQYQGLCPLPPPNALASPLSLLTKGAALIRSLFIEQQDTCLSILPALPPEFHCGRFTQVRLDGLVLNLEWTKKTIRCLEIWSERDQELSFSLHPSIRQFRIRRDKSDKGQKVSCHTPITINKNCYYLIDNFT